MSDTLNYLYTFQVGHSPSLKELATAHDAEVVGDAGYVVRVGVDNPEKQQVEQIAELTFPIQEVITQNPAVFEFGVVLPPEKQFVIVVHAQDAEGNTSKALQYADVADGVAPPLPPGYQAGKDLVPIGVRETDLSIMVETVEPTVGGEPAQAEPVAAG